MKSVDYIGKILDVEIDRPLGSFHPEYGYRYEVNYGYVPNTLSGDGEELDVYLIGFDSLKKRVKGRCIAVIERLDDNDDKLIIISESLDNVSDEEIIKQTYFQEKFFKSILRRK